MLCGHFLVGGNGHWQPQLFLFIIAFVFILFHVTLFTILSVEKCLQMERFIAEMLQKLYTSYEIKMQDSVKFTF